MMKAAGSFVPALVLSVLALGAVPTVPGPFAGEDGPALQTFSPPGFPVDIVYRSLQPGEILKAVLREDPDILRARVRWLGQTRTLETADGGGRPFALLGIDLGAETGSFPLEVTIERRAGTTGSFRADLTVEARDFPRTSLSVAPALVSPPPELTERIRRESELVAAVLGVVSPDWLADGEFRSPLPDHAPFPNFGQRRIYNGKTSSIHAGVDIAAPAGTPARAANAGKIVLASDLYYSGKTVIVDHGLGVFTHYGHFSKLLVRRGDIVAKGDILALVGSTGRSTGPHLHLSVRVLNSRIDPFSLIAFPL